MTPSWPEVLMAPPPQVIPICFGLGWNVSRAVRGRGTISQFCRAHKLATAFGLAGFLAWFIPHIFRSPRD